MGTGRLIQELQGKLTTEASPQSLSAADATKLHSLLRSAKFPNPDGGHLSSAGEYNLRLGVIKELHPELIATNQGKAVELQAQLDAVFLARSQHL